MAGNSKPDFEALGRSIEEAKSLETQAKGIRAEVKNTLFKYINSHWGEDSVKFFPTFDNKVIGREKRVSMSLNEAKLEELLDPEVFNQISYTQVHVDEDKLKVALKDGLIDESVVEQCIEEKVTYALVHHKSSQE